ARLPHHSGGAGGGAAGLSCPAGPPAAPVARGSAAEDEALTSGDERAAPSSHLEAGAVDQHVATRPLPQHLGGVSGPVRSWPGRLVRAAAAVAVVGAFGVPPALADAPPPVANNDSYETAVNTTLNVAAPGVLANDTNYT